MSRYDLTLEVPDHVGRPPAPIVLRPALKTILRTYNVRCTQLRESSGQEKPATGSRGPPAVGK